MATKKAIPVKPERSSGGKKTVKKITKKTTPKSAEKVSVKKTATSKVTITKKAVAPKKAAVAKKTAAPKPARPSGGKVAAKTKKAIPEKSIKSSFLKKGDKNTSKVKEKPQSKAKKDANQLLVDAAVEGVLEVKGRDIAILDLRGINNRVCDYYIICQADSSTQVNAIAGSVEAMVKKRIGEKPYHSEGFQNSEWILVDYVTVVVHVFQSEVREFYNLESLWADAEVTRIAYD